MSLCALTCRQASSKSVSFSSLSRALYSSAPPPQPTHQTLSMPSWSTATLLQSPAGDTQPDARSDSVSPAQLRHLLRLAALPMPKSAVDEAKMLDTLRHQLLFVHAVQRVDTEGVEPLDTIRDETLQGLQEATIGLADLQPALDAEARTGHYRRPRRLIKSDTDKAKPQADQANNRVGDEARPDEEKWDPLSLTSRRVGKYFVVEGQSGRGEAE